MLTAFRNKVSLLWHVLWGRSTIYRVTCTGEVSIPPGQSLLGVECTFKYEVPPLLYRSLFEVSPGQLIITQPVRITIPDSGTCMIEGCRIEVLGEHS